MLPKMGKKQHKKLFFFSQRAKKALAKTVLPNIYKFPLTGLPVNESFSGHGDDHTSNFP